MIFTLFAVIVWIENHNLSSLIQAEEKIQKCPQKGYWTIAVIIGIILSVIAWFMFQVMKKCIMMHILYG